MYITKTLVVKTSAVVFTLAALAACGEPTYETGVAPGLTFGDGTVAQTGFTTKNNGACGDAINTTVTGIDRPNSKGEHTGLSEFVVATVVSKPACANLALGAGVMFAGALSPAAEIDNSSASGSKAISHSNSAAILNGAPIH